MGASYTIVYFVHIFENFHKTLKEKCLFANHHDVPC